MWKFVIKFYALFIITISVMFFSLVFFQKQSIGNHSAPPFPQKQEFGMQHPQEPPIAIPLLLILGISSIFILSFLQYINKSFVIPLTLIQRNLKEIKEGKLDTKFKHNSESKAIKETFNTLNDMVSGLKEKEKLQNNLIQTIAHDLRAPIIAQERAISILQDEFNNHELLEGMLANNETYLKMINLIIEAYNDKKINIEKIDINLFKITNTVIQELSPSAKSKNIIIKNELSQNFTVFADFISINRIMMNLISNAIENIDKEKTISIKGNNDKHTTKIIIEDNGSGIDEETIKHIFEKYSSSNKSRKKLVSGLGLYIVKDLVEKNQGKIYIESELNKYTRFIFELPRKG